MKQLAQLLRSSTRADIVQILASAKKPLSAYRVSKMGNKNIAKVYLEMKKLSNLGLISGVKGSRGAEYVLADENLRMLALKLSPRVIMYEDWRSPRAKAQRFRSGLIKVPNFSLSKQTIPLEAKPTRMRGELDILAQLARSKFDRKYRRKGEREYARV